ncbi:MAG: hypothetical protein K9H64_22445 [Bacteroidales bacterium]|nr:hypothetical protein [Bacteroidales bacterium]MCF8458792.1 hypothetical protein [Bacteroidales bacterium]
MEAVFRLKVSEIDEAFLKVIKSLFVKDKEIEVTFNSSTGIDLFEHESREQYFNRLDKAIENVENGVNLVSFSEEEFDELTKNLLNK